MLTKEDLEANNRRFSAAFTGGQLAGAPARRLIVVTCMDARIDPMRILGLRDGDAHILRNAGGRVSDDIIRSVIVSQQLLGTRQIVLMHHTRCGLLNVTNEELRQRLRPQLGASVDAIDFLPLGADPMASVREDVQHLRNSSALAPDSEVRGYVYDVTTGRITSVD
jgi:carbonic anhydrase